MALEIKVVSGYNINIRHTANGGCIVKVGCCEAAFSTPEEMLQALAEFYDDPKKIEKEYNEIGPPCDTGVADSDPVGHSLGRSPNRVTGSGSSIRNHPIEEAMDPINDGENCEEIGPDGRR